MIKKKNKIKIKNNQNLNYITQPKYQMILKIQKVNTKK